jgi:peptidoglycan/LPS O-acetylase OafA/YrhL
LTAVIYWPENHHHEVLFGGQLRNNNFDFIRFTLALLVIFSHSYPLGTGTESHEPFSLLTRGQTTGGAIAVNLFFVISGFLIAQSWEHSRSLGSFLGKRARRIYPGFIAVMFVSALVICGGAVSPISFVLNSARLDEFHHATVFASNPYPGAMNGSIWSISYEFWCYLGIAALGATGFIWRKRFILPLFAASLVISVLFRVYGWKISGAMLGQIFGYPPFWARLLPLYLAGLVFYIFRNQIRLSRLGALISVGALAISAVLPPLWTLAFPIAGTYLVMWFAFQQRIRLHRFARYGDFSYGIYLYAFPIQQILMQQFGAPVHPWVLFFSAAPLTLIAAVGSWHGVEKWFLKPVRRSQPRISEAARPAAQAA